MTTLQLSIASAVPLQLATDLAPLAPPMPPRLPIEAPDRQPALPPQDALPSPPVLPVLHIATKLRRGGRPDEAVIHLEAALAELPHAWPLWHDLGLALAADGRPSEAASAYRRARALGGARLAAVWVNLGNALRSAGRKAEAVDAYLTAIEVDPEDAAAFYNIHAALYDDADPRAAEAALERALTLRPEHADTHFYLVPIPKR